MSLAQLIYVSLPSPDVGDEQIQEILSTARERNGARAITGYLGFRSGLFLQILEGDRRALTSLFQRIGQDPRHRQVTLLGMHDLEQREFGDWRMGFVALSDENLAAAGQSGPFEAFAPASLRFDTAHDLLLSLSERSQPAIDRVR